MSFRIYSLNRLQTVRPAIIIQTNEMKTSLYTDRAAKSPSYNTANHLSGFQIGKDKKIISISVAKTMPPKILCITIFLCRYLRFSSLTLTFRSKIMSLPKKDIKPVFVVSNETSSSNFSQGRGCLLLNSNKKKQEPRSPDRISPIPRVHIGQTPTPLQREEWCICGEAKARSNIANTPVTVKTIPRPVAMQIVSKVPLATPKRIKLR